MIGDTGSGKSTLMEWLGRQRKYLMVVRTKPDEIEYQTDVRARDVRELKSACRDPRVKRIEVAPPFPTTLDEERHAAARRLQREMARTAMSIAYGHGGWTLDLDELLYIDRLGLRFEYEELSTQGRSLKATLLTGMQRPVQISRFVLSQSKHVYCFALEGRDIAQNLAPATSPRMKDIVPTLDAKRFEFAYYCRLDKRIRIGRLNVETDSLEEIGTA